MRASNVSADEDASDGRRGCKVLVNCRKSLAIDATMSGILVWFMESSNSVALFSRLICSIV